ncbi:MAG: SBBP repeat-containing protein [Candidatus Cloacimonetes bacterium]|nr:SBBP repeat-containing protein [Candidatus Cloacimonadota bacterium]
MNKVFIFIALIIFCSIIYAQTEDWVWAKQTGGTGSDLGSGIATDSSGNSYVTGWFNSTVTLGNTTYTSNGGEDIFIAKLDASGSYLWAKTTGGYSTDYGMCIANDSFGNSYVTGSFEGTATFGTITLTSIGYRDIFIAKIDTHGNWLWVQQAGGISNSYSGGEGIDLDSSGNCYVTGYFENTATFGSTVLTSSGYGDVFITKLDTNGNYLWAKKAGGINDEICYCIAVDSSGNSYVMGDFGDSATFGTTLLTTGDYTNTFIAKLDTNGTWLWVRQIIGTQIIEQFGSVATAGRGIATDDIGNCYVTGCFAGNGIFDSTTLTSSGHTDIFIAKLDTNGNFLWAKQSGGTLFDDGFGLGIATDNSGNSYVTGRFSGNAIFGNYTLISNGGYDIFISKLDTNGNILWAKKAGGIIDEDIPISTDAGRSIAIDTMGNCYITGWFSGTATFGNNLLTSSGAQDIFIAKLAPDGVIVLLNDSSLDFGTTYFDHYSTCDLWLRNIGTATLTVDSLAFMLTDTPFEVMGLTLPLSIAVGDSVGLHIRFTPSVSGSVLDSLIIYNNSINLPRAAIRLNGTGVYMPPLPPEDVTLVMDGNNAIISWDAVTETELHTPIVPDYYLVFYNGSSDSENGIYYYLWDTPGLQFTHHLVGLHAQHMFYRVVAYKYYGRGVFDLTSLGLQPGMPEEEVYKILGY